MSAHRFHPSILREYDIRGIVGDTLNLADATALGYAFTALTRERCQKQQPRIAVGRDGRLSSPDFETHLSNAVTAAGGIAMRIGCGPSPMLYFAAHTLEVDAGIMVTGSHNPAHHNGFKMMIARGSLAGSDIQILAGLAAAPMISAGIGYQIDVDVKDAYVDRLVAGLEGADISRLKIGWDAGNGAAGEIMRRLTRKLPGHHTLLNEVIDGHFPSHHPDPTEPKNLLQLQETVAAQKLDLGIAFDGDGDRIGAVDAQGRIVWGDQLLAILSRDVLARHPGATIIADVKASQVCFDEIARLGGQPLMWKTGHSLIKRKMIETKAQLAGEMSGHIFFADGYFGFDDALFAAVRLLRALAISKTSLTALRDHLPQRINTPEIRIDCADDRKFKVVADVGAALARSGARVDTTDGVRVKNQDGWWLLRASNTQAILVARAEASNQQQLDRNLAELNSYLSQHGLSI